MVSLKRSVKVFCTVICYCFLFCACIYAQTLDKPITECSGSSESRIMCTRDLPDGTKQSGSGWCKCVRGMYQGGCSLPAYSYTKTRYSSLTGQQCLDCTVPGVIKGCGTISQIVDETPSCGEWYSCGGTPIVKECTSGQVQYKPKDPCGTSERTCCSNGKWSEWGDKCGASSSCGLNECWNGLKCEAKGAVSKMCSGNVANAKSGTLTRTATCGSSGWNYDSWSGTCTCNTGYTWNSSSKTCGAKTCSGGDFYNASSDKCCSVGSYMVHPGTDGNYMFVNCKSNDLDVTGECCTMSNNAEFQLPSSAGSCSKFASKAGLSVNPRINRHACLKYI